MLRVGVRCVALVEGPVHPLLVPPDLIHPVVMAAAIRRTGLVKLGMPQERRQGTLSSG